MFHIVFNDIKKMLLRPAVALLLILGLIVASAAGVIYFSYASTSLNVKSMAILQDRTVEVRSCGDAYFESEELLRLIDEGKLPAATYVSAISYSFENYDIIGYKQYEQYLVANSGGEFINDEDEQLLNAVVTPNFKEDGETIFPGDTVKINARDFNVKGVCMINSDMFMLFDYRRMPEGSEFVAGMDLTLDRDEETLNRPDKLAIVSMQQYLKLTDSYGTSLFHITFAEPITEAQREEIETIIADETGMTSFIPITVFQETNTVKQWSNAAVYLIAVLAGIINIIGLFAFFIRENKRQYSVYRLLGASRPYIVAVILLELFIFTLVSYIIACGIAILTIRLGSEGIFKYASVPSIGSLILLFCVIYMGSILVSIGQIRRIIMPEKKRRKKRSSIIGGLPSRAKGLYLLSFQYGRRNISGVISTVALSLAVALCFTYAMTYVFEGDKFTRYYDQNYSEELVLLSFDDMKNSALGESVISGETPDIYNSEMYSEIHEAIREKSYVSSFCLNPFESVVGFVKDFEEGERDSFDFIEYEKDYIKNVKVPLSKGRWEDMLSYDASDEDAVIPCVVLPSVEQELPYGSEFVLDVSFCTGITDISGSMEDGSFACKGVVDKHERRFKVVGVISDEAYLSWDDLNCYGSTPDVTNFLTSADNITHDFITPTILHNSKRQFTYNQPNCLIFIDKDATEEQREELSELLLPYGQTRFLSDAVERYASMFSSGGGEIYVMHSIISGLLLLFGIGGFTLVQFSQNRRTYGVYYTCGMRWAQATRLMLASNAINTLIPAAAGAALGIVIATAVRGSFAPLSVILSMISGIGAVAAIYAVISVFTALYIKKQQPKNLLTEESK